MLLEPYAYEKLTKKHLLNKKSYSSTAGLAPS